jgi:hypothetical protein
MLSDLLHLQPLEILPLWVMYLLTVIMLLLAAEGGYRLSKMMQHRRPDGAEASVGTLNGATLALLAFLLAFVTSSAVNIFSDRRRAVVDEANAIGTTYLRANYLPDPYAKESRQLLREYVDQQFAALDQAKIAQALTRSEEIHSELWTRAETLAKAHPSPMTGLYIASLNEVIDLHTDRINAELVLRLPSGLMIVLYVMAVLALGLVGLYAGYAEKRNLIALVVFVLILAMVFLLLADLSRSQSGMFRVSHQALIDLQRQFNTNISSR